MTAETNISKLPFFFTIANGSNDTSLSKLIHTNLVIDFIDLKFEIKQNC